MNKINKSCKNGSCCLLCNDRWKHRDGKLVLCKNTCDSECENCSCKSTGYCHDGGWYND